MQYLSHFLCLSLVAWTCTASSADFISLSGKWQFALDRENVGVEQEWFNKSFDDLATLPGTVVENGYGDDITVNTKFLGHVYNQWYDSPRYAPYRQPGSIKIPSFLTPPKHYVGPAWFVREINTPESWQGKNVFLFMERCNFQSTVWIDGKRIGSQDSLSTPHLYDLGRLRSGRHRLALCINNQSAVNVGVSHAVNDWIQTQWNGAVGQIMLKAKDLVYIENIQAYPDLRNSSVRLKIKVNNRTGAKVNGVFALQADAFNSNHSHTAEKACLEQTLDEDTQTVETTYFMGKNFLLWDEFSPSLYKLTVHLQSQDSEDQHAVTFGMREFGIEGKRFTINGRKTMLRGTHEAGLFPLTGYASMKLEAWRRVFARCREFGLNHMRFHSWCPPEAAFRAADELGFYLQVEGPFNCSIGDGNPVDDYLKAELTRILDTYGNHPSFALMSHGNEPSGENKDAFLAKEVLRWKALDSRHKYTAGSGWPILKESDFHCNHNPRLQLWGEGLMSRINSIPPAADGDFGDLYRTYDRPMLIHEAGQWCVYPNFNEIKKYQGVLKARNFEIFRDFLEQNHMGGMAEKFLMASGKLQVLCYKAEIEHSLRTPDGSGFQLLDLHDYSGQGSALVGVLDPFWDPKPYITGNEFRRFCNSTVPLAKMKKLVWTSDETFEAELTAAHFGPQALKDVTVGWTIGNADHKTIKQGRFKNINIALGDNRPLGQIAIALKSLAVPAKYNLCAGIEQTDFSNNWDFWVYPGKLQVAEPEQVHIVAAMDDAAQRLLANGAKVLLMPDAKSVQSPCKIGFSSMFWNVTFTEYQAPHTLGILCDPGHPVFNDFPTDYHSNWQWWDIIRQSTAIVIDRLDPQIRPLIQPIDNWFDARRLSLLYEARVGNGRLAVCTMDLKNDLANRPAARQLRYSLLRYLASDRFNPSVSATVAEVQSLLSVSTQTSTLATIGAKIHFASAEVNEAKAANLIDGKADTIWLSNRQHQRPAPPHYVIIDMGKAVNVAGITYLPRQDVSGGRIGSFKVYVTDDAENWGKAVIQGKWPDSADLQRAVFPEPHKGRYLVIRAETEVHTWPYVSIAEIDIVADWRN